MTLLKRRQSEASMHFHAYLAAAIARGTFCPPDAAETELILSEKEARGAGCERFPLSHENCPRCLTVSEPATQSDRANDTWPRDGGRRLASVILGPYRPTIILSISYTHTLSTVDLRCSPVWLPLLEQCSGWFQSCGRWQEGFVCVFDEPSSMAIYLSVFRLISE